MQNDSMITSESVTEGHPDKLCDQISDAIVDHVLVQDRCARILKRFQLRDLPARNPDGFYRKLAACGQVGRADMDLPWERTDSVRALS